MILTYNPTQQRMLAMDRANEIRCVRAADKRAIKQGTKSVKEVINENPTEWRTAKVLELLKAQHRVGTFRAHLTMKKAALDSVKTLGELTERQRILLCWAVDEVMREKK